MAETSYTGNTTYPAGSQLYWRVQAIDAGTRGLSYSSTGTFQKTLPVPTFDNVSVYPLLARLTGVRPERNDGSLSDTAKALR